jgi:hypothetical protein
MALEFSFGRALKQLVDLLLGLLADLLLAAFLTNRAGDVLDFDKVGLYRRSRQIHLRSALWASSGHRFQYNFDTGVLPIARMN